MQISRTLGWRASIDTNMDLQEIKKLPFNGSIGQWMKQRFGILIQDDRTYRGNEGVIDFYKKLIFEKSRTVKKNYLSYWESCRGNQRNIAVVDFVSSGTCQKRLEKISGQKLQGLYFETISNMDKTDYADDYIQALGAKGVHYFYFLLELLIKEPTASVKDIDENGSFCFGKLRLTQEQIVFIKQVHMGVMDFVTEYIDMIQDARLGEDNNTFVKAIITIMNDKYIQFDKQTQSLLNGFDEFTNRALAFT